MAQTPLGGDNPDRPTALVAGLGLVTPLGADVPQTWRALLAGQYITDHCHAAVSVPPDHCPLTHLTVIAAREAIAQAGWTKADLANDQTALVVGTSKGSATTWITPLSDHCRMESLPYEAVGRLTPAGLGQLATNLADELGLGYGPRMLVSAACTSGLQALIRGTLLIWSGQARRVVVVAGESSIHPLFLGSFQRLGLLPPPEIGCRPFDHSRAGFLMSQAAAAICLASGLSHSHSEPMVAIERLAMGGDAVHLTGGDAQGITLSRLIRHVVDHRPVDLVHAHGTATTSNDPVELAAIQAAITATGGRPLLYSHKGALGHSLGAAGLVAGVINCLAHQHGVVPPNPRVTKPLAMSAVELATTIQRRTIRRSILTAAGFGGAMAAVSLKTV